MNWKYSALTCIALLAFLLGMSAPALALRLLSQEEALKQMFPDTDEVVTETIVLSDEDVAKVKARLGGQLVHYQEGTEGNINEKTSFTFYIGKKGGATIRVAIIDEQPGKWGPVEYIVAMNTATGKVQNLAVMAYFEKRGRPIARNNFLNQFVGKGAEDPIMVRKDIRAISGATISSDATCFVVKKVIALYEDVYLVKSKLAQAK